MKQDKELSVLEATIYYLYFCGWVIAPMLVNKVLEAREVHLPSDLGTAGTIIWYAIGLGQTVWLHRNDRKR